MKDCPDTSDYSELIGIRRSLADSSPRERFEAFYWLLDQKHNAIDHEHFEHASVLKDSLNDLEDILLPYKQAETYHIMVGFLIQEEGLKEDQIEAKYERFVLKSIKANINLSGEMNLAALDILMVIWPLKFVEYDFNKVREFAHYFNSMDETKEKR
jgi:hypothetical protein